MEELKALHRKQGSLKSKLTAFRKLLDAFLANRKLIQNAREEGTTAEAPTVTELDPVVSVNQLRKSLEISKNYLIDYEQLHDQAVLLESEESLQTCCNNLTAFQTSYIRATAEATELIEHFEKIIHKKDKKSNEPKSVSVDSVAENSANIVAVQENVAVNNTPALTITSTPSTSTDLSNDDVQNHVSNNSGASIHLPVLNIPRFDGQCEQFNSFYASFCSLIHNNLKLPIISKFLYLKSCLGVQPQRLIEHLDLLDGNYETALQLLEKRYKDTKLMIHTHLKAIISCPPVNRSNSNSLRLITDTAQVHIRALKTLGEPVESWASIIQFLIIDKLDFSSKKEWEAATLDIDHPSLCNLFSFLEKRCQLLEKFDQNTDKTKNISREPPSKPKFNGN